jgi:tRNA dimethylallyltransferase
VTHHLLDIIGPYDHFSAAEFKRLAEERIQDIQARGKTAIIVGGTGLYIDALLFDFSFADKADENMRDTLNNMSVSELQAIIVKKSLPMPGNGKNPRHLIRAIESAGRESTKSEQRLDATVVGIDPGRDELQRRTAERIEHMLNAGFVDEVKNIVKVFGDPPVAWDAIGYKIVLNRLTTADGPTEKLIAQDLLIAHRQYAKRQRAWFKRNKNIIWFEQTDEAFRYIQKELNNS